MFKRRTPLSFPRKIRETLWPSMGLKRTGLYFFRRLVRLSDSTHRIAAGLAIGVLVSFSPLLGTHFLQCVLLCLILRANLLAAFVGTAAGNPWTLPFIWWTSYETGKRIAGFFGWEAARAPLPNQGIDLSHLWYMIVHHPMDILLPWMIGGYLLGTLVGFLSYFLFYGLVRGARLARGKLKRKKFHVGHS